MSKTFGELCRGDQFVGNPHGGWIFIKTDGSLGNHAIRLADGGIVSWNDEDRVKLIKNALHKE